MATLPDLDTASIGYIAYWNAIDQGSVASIDPDEVLSDPSIIDYTIYDNGVEGTYNTLLGRNMTFRVKNDGWMIVYVDRTNNFNAQAGSPGNVRGYWDFANNWTDTAGGSDFVNNVGERTINSLRTELPNSGSMTYSTSDVGLYNYEYTSATNTTWLASWTGGGSYGGGSTNKDAGVLYTSDTTRYYWAGIGAGNGNDSNFYVDFEGITIADSGGTDYGAIDIIDRGIAPDAETEYILSVYRGGAYRDTSGESHGGLLAMWA